MSHVGAYLQYSRLLSVLNVKGMSSVSSGVTKAQQCKPLAEQAHRLCPKLLLYVAKEKLQLIKGIAHPKLKIQSLSPHPHADERRSAVFCPHNAAGVSQVKGIAVTPQTFVGNGD